MDLFWSTQDDNDTQKTTSSSPLCHRDPDHWQPKGGRTSSASKCKIVSSVCDSAVICYTLHMTSVIRLTELVCELKSNHSNGPSLPMFSTILSGLMHACYVWHIDDLFCGEVLPRTFYSTSARKSNKQKSSLVVLSYLLSCI